MRTARPFYREYAPVAQLDRVSDSDSEGRWFESSRAYQVKSYISAGKDWNVAFLYSTFHGTYSSISGFQQGDQLIFADPFVTIAISDDSFGV